MEDPRSLRGRPSLSPPSKGITSTREGREDWEDWEEESPSTPKAAPKRELLVARESQSSPKPKNKAAPRTETRSASRFSVQKPLRLKSRGRQKAQNAKAGIKLVTDMTKFRKQQHIAHQARLPAAAAADTERNMDRRNTGKFVDFAALRALEGNQTEASVGSWGWLKRRPTLSRSHKSPLKSRRQKNEQDLSPADRPIVIGIALPEDDLVDRVISPETATLDTPLDLSRYLPGSRPSPRVKPVSPSTAQQQRSVWSPDTDDSPFTPSRGVSSVYTLPSPENGNVPPVPNVPSGYKSKARIASIELDDDNDTPITLFEEDGSPVVARKSAHKRGHARSPAAASATRSGWWDHVNTPFVEQASNNPFRPRAQSPKEEEQEEWWKGADEKKTAKPVPLRAGLGIAANATGETIASSSRSAPSPSQRQESMSDKGRILMEENQIPSEEPPPYEPTARQERSIRYHAVFPPGHRLREQYPPSPGPISPGLANTMTSQGAISMTDVPLTPATQRAMPTGPSHLPDRPLGSLAPGGHVPRAAGSSPAARIERQRRRHEKEDAVARRVEGFWKGRGCLPENGCYGRRGREGRKRRRICFGIFGAILALIVLIVVLAVVLTRRGPAEVPYSMWLNITGFPPIPTGVTTVVGPDNAEAVAGCVQPSTLWTCSLPKEEHQENEPFRPEQPKFIIQIQYDNGTRQLWNVPDGPIPGPTRPAAQNTGGKGDPKNAINARGGPAGVLSRLRSLVRRADSTQAFAPGFAPQPSPPPFAEYYFLGNTTDRVASLRKAGEPTPFFISFLPSLNATVGPNIPTGAADAPAGTARRRRGLGNGITFGKDGNISSLLPPPALNADGSPAAAVLRPMPVQQPLRLFDRGLPTEHFGFHSYFDKRHYVTNVDGGAGATDGDGAVPADRAGGASVADARFVITSTQTRFRVQIWTRLNGTADLLGTRGGGGGGGASNTTQPGTFPYPVTIAEDTHGGDFNLKGSFARRIVGGRVSLDNPSLVVHNLAFGGTLVNHGEDMALGGVDGGTGGCRCAWRNWVSVSGGSIGI